MDKDQVIGGIDIEYLVEQGQDAESLVNALCDRLQYYQKKNKLYEQVLSKLKVSPESLSFAARDTLKKLTKLQDASGVHKLDLVDVEMSYLDNEVLRQKFQDKSEKIKNQFEDLRELTDSINAENKNIKREIFEAKTKIDSLQPISENELQKLQLQIKCYEEKLIQYINKYPWLNNPEYNMLSIQEEIKKVYHLQEEVDKLKSQTECYHGLSPDVFTAKNQLSKIKIEYEKISKLVSEKECSI